MASSGGPGVYLQTTQIWDVDEIREVDVTKPAFKELLVRMYQNLNTMALSINNKESAFYDLSETVKGQSFFPNQAHDSTTATRPEMRQVFNKVVNFGALPNAAIKTVAHGIAVNTGYTFTRIYGCATDPIGLVAIPLPYVDPAVLANGILLSVGAANVTITTAADYSAYTVSYVVLEYIKC